MHRVVLVLLLLLTACGRSEPAPVVTASPSPSPTPSPTPTPKPRDPFELARSYEATSPFDLLDRLREASDFPAAQRALVQQSAYRQIARTPEWKHAVYSELDADDLARTRANVEAAERLRQLTPPRTELPPWHIVEPPTAKELRGHYDAAAKEFGIDWSYLAAIHLTETRMGRIRGDSTAGAKGPMQFLPSTWAAYGEGDIEDPRDAIRAAARYLKAHGAPQDMSRALFAYNHSDHYVRAVSIYAEQMRTDKNAYADYHQWQVYYRTTKGDALLYEGWPSR